MSDANRNERFRVSGLNVFACRASFGLSLLMYRLIIFSSSRCVFYSNLQALSKIFKDWRGIFSIIAGSFKSD